jgi:hypothetical protein
MIYIQGSSGTPWYQTSVADENEFFLFVDWLIFERFFFLFELGIAMQTS